MLFVIVFVYKMIIRMIDKDDVFVLILLLCCFGSLWMLWLFVCCYSGLFIVWLLVLVVLLVVMLSLFFVVKQMIDYGFISGGQINCVFVLLMLVVVVLVLVMVVWFFFVLLLGEKVVVDLCSCLYVYLIQFGVGFYDCSCSGELVLCLIVDSELLCSVVGLIMLVVLCSSVIVVGSLVMLFVISLRLVVWLLFGILLVVLLIIIGVCKLCMVVCSSQDCIVDVNSLVSEMLGVVCMVQVYVCEFYECGCFDKVLGDVIGVVCWCIGV